MTDSTALHHPGDRVRWESGGKMHFGRIERILREADGLTYLVARGRLPLIYVHEARLT